MLLQWFDERNKVFAAFKNKRNRVGISQNIPFILPWAKLRLVVG